MTLISIKNNTPEYSNGSPFDSIRQTRPDGSEFWSARDLWKIMGYSNWQHFQSPLNRAMATARNQGLTVEDHFTGSRKVMNKGRWGNQSAEDFELSRYAAYLVAMNGDPNKPEVAAAQHYFAVNTRENEVRKAEVQDDEDILIARALIASNKKTLALEAKLEEVSPKVEFFDDYVSANGLYYLNDAAKQLGWRPMIMRQELVDQEILCKIPRGYTDGYEHLPRQIYMNQGYFEVKTDKYHHASGFSTYSKTMVTPKGMTWLAKRLGEDDGKPRSRKKPEPNPIDFNYVPSRFL